MYHDLSDHRSCTDPDLDHSKGIHPYILPAILKLRNNSMSANNILQQMKLDRNERDITSLLHNIALKFGLY